MTVYHRFDLFRMNFHAAYVDHAVSSTGEMKSAIPKLEHVAGVDETIRAGDRLAFFTQIAGRDARRADSKRSILNMHFDIATAPHQTCGNARQAISHFKRD